TSHFLAARDHHEPLAAAVSATLAGASAYTDTLIRLLGKSKPANLDVNDRSRCRCPLIDDLIAERARLKRSEFIDKLTEMKDGKRRLKRSARCYNLTHGEIDEARRALTDYRQRMQDLSQKDDYFAVEDVAG